MKKSVQGIIAAMGLALSGQTMAASLSVTVENLTHGNLFTPLLIAAHPAANHLFQTGTAASTSLQAMAEGGNLAPLVTDLGAINADFSQDPNNGVLTSGSTSPVANLTTAAANTHLSVVAMILPTNDGFIGLDAIKIPTTPGTYIYHINGYDAGTEVNNELMDTTNGGTPGTLGIPGGSSNTGGTGVTTVENNTNIHIHRGVIGDTNATAGVSDLDSTVHRWLNPIAKLTLTVN